MPGRKTTSYVEDLHSRLKDPSYAAEYLNAVLEDNTSGRDAAFLIALRDVAEAARMSKVAGNAQVNRENLYRMLSRKGNPRLTSLLAVMKALDLRFRIEAAPVRSARRTAKRDAA